MSASISIWGKKNWAMSQKQLKIIFLNWFNLAVTQPERIYASDSYYIQ